MMGVAKTFPNRSGLWEFFTFPESFRGAPTDADRFKFHIWCVAVSHDSSAHREGPEEFTTRK